MRFREFNQDDKLDFGQMATEVQKMWQQKNIFARTLGEDTAAGERRAEFVFYEGPPSANGPPGIHHVMARSLKDVFCRYKTLKGYRVPRVAGWDAHGLPVELGVEQELGITKQDIGQSITVAEFNDKCLAVVGRYQQQWEQLTTAMGYWVQLDQAYKTCSAGYIAAVWWVVAEIDRRGYLYKGHSIQPYSPGAGTALSSHELNQPGCYRIVKDLSCVVQFPVTDPDQLLRQMDHSLPADAAVQQIALLAWTTTPWTLPAHCALGVNAAVSYVLVGTWHKYTSRKVLVVLAEEALARYFGDAGELAEFTLTGEFWHCHNSGDYDHRYFAVLGQCTGKALVGMSYEPPFTLSLPEIYQTPGGLYEVVADDFVSTAEGSGVVHLAPCYGADDYRVCQQHGIGTKDIVSTEGRYYDDIATWGGRYIKSAYVPGHQEAATAQSLDMDLVMDLKQRERAFRIFKVEHSYPHCWRSDVPIFYRPVDSWFVRTTAIKDKLIALNQTIRWYPPAAGTSRFADWLANLVDWNISRTRYWGTPLPIWTNRAAVAAEPEARYEYRVMGSVAELRQAIAAARACGLMAADPLAAQEQHLDLHRTSLDGIVLADSQGRPMYRESDVLDVWFDSGAMPYAAAEYPARRDALRFPADFIAEGVDQTRGWFFSLHVIAALCFDAVAYKHVLACGLVLDKAGRKMSKRLGNTVDPMATIDKYGADIVRWYMLSNAKPWENLKFDEAGLQECSNKFFQTLFQVYQFFAVYANIDGFTPEQFAPECFIARIKAEPEYLSTFDRWLMAELHTLIAGVQGALDEYDPTTATRQIGQFTLEVLSNWYVRLNRRRFWKAGEAADKSAGYHTLWYVLYSLSQLAAPFAPMLSDWLFGELGAASAHVSGGEQLDSVHLGGFPHYDATLVDRELMVQMAQIRQIASLILSLREKAGIRVRQPLACAYLVDLTTQDQAGAGLASLGDDLVDLVQRETNVKVLKSMDAADPMLRRTIKPNYPRLGKRLGRRMPAVAAWLGQLSAAEISRLQRGDGDLSMEVTVAEVTETITLTAEDVIITYADHAQLLMATSGELTVALSTHIDETLRNEGIMRELVNRVQHLRKDQGLAITDRITMMISEQPTLQQALSYGQEFLLAETLCEELQLCPLAQMPAPAATIAFDDIEVKVLISPIAAATGDISAS